MKATFLQESVMGISISVIINLLMKIALILNSYQKSLVKIIIIKILILVLAPTARVSRRLKSEQFIN